MLMEIEDALRPEERRNFKGDNAPSRPASRIKTDKPGTVTVEPEKAPALPPK